MVSHTKKRCPKGRKRCKRSMKGGGDPNNENVYGESTPAYQPGFTPSPSPPSSRSHSPSSRPPTLEEQQNLENNARRGKAARVATGTKPRRQGAFRRRAIQPIFQGSTPSNSGNNNKVITPAKYVFVFDYDHTLTNSYGIGTHSNGHSYNGNGLFTKTGEPSVALYNSVGYESVGGRGDYDELVKQLSYFKESGALMFVNSRGIQSQLLQRLKADELLKYFGISDKEGDNKEIKYEFTANGNIDEGVYGANEDKDIANPEYTKDVNADKWGELKVKVIENILEKLQEKNMIDADTEVHFFDDEPGNVDKFNSHFNPQMVKEFNSYEKSVNTKYKGHYIGNRGGAGKPSITEKLEMMNIALEYKKTYGLKVNIIDRINVKDYNLDIAAEEAGKHVGPLIIIRNSSKGGYAYDVKNNEGNIKHFRDIMSVRNFLLKNAKTIRIGFGGGSRKQRKPKKSTRKSTRKQRKPKKSSKKHRKHKKTTKKH